MWEEITTLFQNQKFANTNKPLQNNERKQNDNKDSKTGKRRHQ